MKSRRLLALFVVSLMMLSLMPAFSFTAAALVEAPAEVWVSPDYNDTTDGWDETRFDSIQDAVDAVAAMGTVHVLEGTYNEQVIINKNLTLIGYDATIVAPASSYNYHLPDETGSSFQPVIFAFGGGINTVEGNMNVTGTGIITVDISGFTIDGSARIPVDRSAGILLRNVQGEIHHNTLDNFDLTKQTFGIIVYGDSDLEIYENTIEGFGRGGIGILGNIDDAEASHPNAEIFNNTVITVTHASWAQNGIQIGWGATGVVENNVVEGHIWADDGWGATGILIAGSSDVLVKGNTVFNNDYGVCVAGYVNLWGGPRPSANVQIVDNVLYENLFAAIGIQGDVTDTLIKGNDIYDNRFGFASYDFAPTHWSGGGVPLGTIMEENKIYGNEYGVYVWDPSEGNEPVDAEYDVYAVNNWWGHIEGPTTDSEEPKGDSVSAYVIYKPWASDEDFAREGTHYVVDDPTDTLVLYDDNFIHIPSLTAIDGETLTMEADGQVKVEIPASILPDDVSTLDITVTRSDPDAVEGFKFLSSVFTFTMADEDGTPITEFDGTMTITFYFDSAEVDDPDMLDVYWFDGTEWVALSGVVDEVAGTVTVEVDHWSDFALMEEEAPVLEPEPETPETGTSVMLLIPFGLLLMLAGAFVIRKRVLA